MYCFVQRKMEGTYIRKNELIISGNKDYIGIIDEDNGQVRIISHSGNEISHFDINYSSANILDLHFDISTLKPA